VGAVVVAVDGSLLPVAVAIAFFLTVIKPSSSV